jgi:ABC-2 type transport system permease protein
MKQFLAFVWKEFLHVFRDTKTLLLLFGLPIIQIILFGFALTNEIKNSKVVVCDYAKDNFSKKIIHEINQSQYFDVTEYVNNHLEIDDVFRKGNAKIAIVFPNKFEHEALHSGVSTIQIIADVSDPNSGNTRTAYISSILNDFQMRLLQNYKLPLQIQIENKMIYNPELKGTTNFVPGVMSLVLLLVCVLMTSVSIVREKELGTMEILLVSPFNPLFVIISKAVPYLVLSIINLIVILLLSVYLLDLPIKGNVILLFAESMLYIITALSLGLLISNITESQQSAMLISLMGMLLPTLIFTGFMFPIENMPLPLQIISRIIPSRYYFIIVKSIMIKGLGFSSVWKETLILLSITLFLLTLSFKKFKIRLS